MLLLIWAVAVELWLPSAVMTGLAVTGVAKMLEPKPELSVVPLEGGWMHAGRMISPEELQQPEFQKVREYLRIHADLIGLTPQQREAVAA